MTAPTLSDRILAALSKDPCTEGDLTLIFPRVAPDAIRVKLAELKRAGKVMVGAGVWTLARGVVTPIVDGHDHDEPEAELASPEPPPPPPPVDEVIPPDTRVCDDCRRELPMHEFGRSGGGGRRTMCRKCHGARCLAGKVKRVSPTPEPSPAPREQPQPDVELPREHPFTLESDDEPGEAGSADVPIATVKRTTSLTVRDAYGIFRTWVLDDDGVRAALAALQECAA